MQALFTQRSMQLHCRIAILFIIFIAFGFWQIFKNNNEISNPNCKLQQIIHICFWGGMLLKTLQNPEINWNSRGRGGWVTA